MDIESIRVGTVVTEALWPEPLVREPWVSVDDVAKHLGIAKNSIHRWIEGKGLPAHKIGRLEVQALGGRRMGPGGGR